jgi:dynein heavy chain
MYFAGFFNVLTFLKACKLLSGLLPSKENKESLQKTHLERLYVFAVMWSVGAFLELDDRHKLELFIRASTDFKLDLPRLDEQTEETIFDYFVNENGDWQHWSTKVEEYAYPGDHTPEYGSILVPNVDNVRTDFLIHTIAKQQKVSFAS